MFFWFFVKVEKEIKLRSLELVQLGRYAVLKYFS